MRLSEILLEFKKIVPYKGFDVLVKKTEVKPPYVAVVTSRATDKEILKTGGNSEQEALDSAMQAIDKREADTPKISSGGTTSVLLNTLSNQELLDDPSIYDDLYAKISKDNNGATLVIGNEIYSVADLLADGFAKSYDRRSKIKIGGEESLPQIMFSASNKDLSQAGIKMNGRYTIDTAGEYKDDADHVVYPLQFQGVTVNPQDQFRMKKPGLTIGAKRTVEFQEGTRCWKGYTKKGMKTMFGKRVPNCVKAEDVDYCVNCHELVFAEDLDENLKKWFKDKWVRFGPDGKIRGDCARGSSKEGKPKCLPKSKAQSLGKKGRKSAASRKRRQDPNKNRRGKAKNVATKKK